MDDNSSDKTFHPDDDDVSFATSDDDVDRYVDVGVDNSCEEDKDDDDSDAVEYWDIPYFTP